MAITRVQFTVGGGDGSQGTDVATANFSSGVTSGNDVLVVVRNGSSGTALSSVTDTLGTTYGLVVSDTSTDPSLFIYQGRLGSSGTNAITAHFGANTNYVWVVAIEVSGLKASSVVDATDSKTGSGVTDLVSNPITTTQADEYVMMAASQNTFTTYTAGADFTLLDGTIPTNSTDFGGVQERITTGTLSGYTAHITSGVTNNYAVILASFKAAATGTMTPAQGPLTLAGLVPPLNYTINMPDEA